MNCQHFSWLVANVNGCRTYLKAKLTEVSFIKVVEVVVTQLHICAKK